MSETLMNEKNDLLIRAGRTAHHQWVLDIAPEQAGWRFSGIRIVELAAGGSQELATGEDEVLVLPLRGSCSVEAEGTTYELAGRPDVFTAVTDYLYLPRDTSATITSAGGGRFAIPTARATRRLEVSDRPASEVLVGLRGAGSSSRQVNNYALGNDLDTDHLLVCESAHPRWELVLLPAAQARCALRRGARARRDLLLRRPSWTRRPGLRVPSHLRHGPAPDRDLRGGPLG